MRNEAEVIARITELKANLLIVEERIQEELKSHHSKWNFRLLGFLKKEKEIWEFALGQLEWLTSDKTEHE
ncbi:hypothetical protein [Chitinophaga japonensis]|uniref:Uncharacterized protein n=1 Tax=Chitinophaga japonensis TaxID=104662 RepID=A0A562SU09_CHIJA|nr:hypothetical protein [Chitinophaga japonensis]TWI84563.1 hypothetical protein LX66_4933 [Chitinophaga japonensis]